MNRICIVLVAIVFSISSCKEEIFVFPDDGIVSNNDGSLEELKAVGKYMGNSSCSAVFVKVSDNLDASAFVLTNAHCVQGWNANEINFNVTPENHQVTFNVFKDAQPVKVKVKNIVYSTMKGTDIAVVELNTTVKSLIKQGIAPLPIANSVPNMGSVIKVFGVPVTGIEEKDQYLRLSSCFQGKKTDLIEFDWTWWDMYSNECGNIVGGSSGSAAISSIKEGVFGLINTTTIGAETPCYLGAPCESTSQGVSLKENTSYTLSVVGLSDCFNSNGAFDINAPNCTLDKGNGVDLSGSPIGSINPSGNDIFGNPTQNNWNYNVSGKKHYRFKIGKLGESNPRDLKGYSEVLTVGKTITDILPKDPGHYYLAVIGGDSPSFDASWQQVTAPTIIRIEINTQGPSKDPIVQIRDFGDLYAVSLGFSPPELSNYVYKIGKPSETNENDMKNYITYRRIPFDIYKDELPMKICVIGYNNAGNPTKPYVKIIEK